MLHRLFAVLLFSITLSTAFASQRSDFYYLNEYKAPRYSKKEIRSAKFLEDYQWSLRKNLRKRAITNYRKLKKANTFLYRKYRKILAKGISKNHHDCALLDENDPIANKIQSIIYRNCRSEKIRSLLKTKGKLSLRENKILNSFFNNLIRNPYKGRFLARIESMGPRDRILVSSLIKSFIKENRALPSKDFLNYMIIDHEITQFIQDHKLFEQRSNSLFSKEFKSLVNKFKSQFINGEESEAKEALARAIHFYEKNSENIDPDKAWMLFIISGKKLARKHEYNLAIDMFKLSEKIANEENQYESKFQTLFALYRDQSLDKARDFISKQDLIKNFSEIGSKLRFWVANIYDQSKEYKRAKELYLQQISLSPLNFYSIISLRKLRRLAPHYNADLLVQTATDQKSFPKLSKEALRQLKLYELFCTSASNSLSETMAISLRKMNSDNFFRLQSDDGEKSASSLKAYFLITYFSKKGEHLHSFKEAYSKLNTGNLSLNSQVVDSLFPNEFSKLVKSSTGSLDHRFVLSLIRQESAFDKRARSIVGARGLMQIMPRTGQQFVKNLKAHKLYEPKTNVRIGAKFLRNLLKRFEGNFIFALAAYNAGLGNVSRWMKTIPFSQDMLANIEMIPFKETRNYVKLIYRNYFFYKFKEGNTKTLDIPTNQTFNIAITQ